MLAAGLLATGCSKDNPFGAGEVGEGSVLKSALDISRSGDDIQISTKATNDDVDVNEFMVSFIKDGDTQAYRSWKYGEMAEVVTLPVATYKVLATLGEDRDAAWENPYYRGESAPFDIVANEITSYIEPVECSMQNVKVTIEFDPLLLGSMSADSYVEVKVGQEGSAAGLNFTRTEAASGKAGYFKYSAENTLVATFNGTVDGSKITATKSMTDIKAGHWYKLTFKLHTGSGDGVGDGDGSVSVDASVTTEDVNAGVTVEEDQPLDDSERPEDPDNGDTPDDPEDKKAPEFIAVTAGLKFDEPNPATGESECVFKVKSYAKDGLTQFTCQIISNEITDEVLEPMGLSTNLDLANTPDDVAAVLSGEPFYFPVKVAGKKEVTLDLTPFMNLMAAFTGSRQEFKITIADANGIVTKSIILQF